VHRLKPGQRPPQFVVVSFDGAGNHDLFQHYLALARQTQARFTFFLSAIYLLPEDLRSEYRPEHEPVGSSAIGFADRSKIPDRLADLSEAWTQGHDIGTHFNGHFCDANGIQTWDAAGWRRELDDVFSFLEGWPKRTGLKRPPLPFTAHDIQGDRTPCLMGQRPVMLPVFKSYGFRYDASATGELAWPQKEDGLWSFPLQRIKMTGTNHYVLSMDYNFFANQTDAVSVHGAAAEHVERQSYQSLMDAYRAVDSGNRAPLIVGNHFNDWSDGAYVRSLTDFVRNVCDRPGTQCISFRDLADWLDAQDPRVLAALREQGVQPE
jgi:hypothetical protein